MLIFKKITIFAFLFLLLINVYSAQAGKITEKLQNVGATANYNVTDNQPIWLIVGKFIQVFLSFLGVIFIILVIYAGYLWMTDRGGGEQMKKAGTILENAVIGLVLVVSAYILTYTILYYVTKNSGLILDKSL